MHGSRRLAVVIVTWNAGAVVGECLDSLLDNPPSLPWEVVVVDNASSDHTRAVVSGHPVGARLIVNDVNRGLAAANNQGIAASAADYVLIANPDTKLQPGAIDALLDLLGRHERAAFAIPLLRRPDGRLQTSVGDLPSLREALLGRQAQARGGARGRGTERGFFWDGWAHDSERMVGRGQEACYLVRRRAIDRIGPQDERYRLDWEGVDWAARAARDGWEIWFTPGAEVIHVGGASISQAPLRWIVGSHRGIYRYFAKTARPAVRPLLAIAIGLRGLLKAAAAFGGPASYRRAARH